MATVSKDEMLEHLSRFQVQWEELNKAWIKSDYALENEYPFDKCFNEKFTEIVTWIDRCEREVRGKKTFHDMKESRKYVSVGQFEDETKQETHHKHDCIAVVYFDFYYIILTHEGTFHLTVINNDYESNNLHELEKILWDDFLKDEI